MKIDLENDLEDAEAEWLRRSQGKYAPIQAAKTDIKLRFQAAQLKQELIEKDCEINALKEEINELTDFNITKMDRKIRFLKLANCFPSESLEKTWEKMINMEKEITTLKSELEFLSEELKKKEEKRPDPSPDIQEIINNLKESDIDFMLKKLFGMREDLKEVLKDSDDLRVKISNAIVAATEVAFVLSSYTKEGSYMDKLMEVIKERKG